MPELYKNLKPQDFDAYDCVKLSKGFYLILLYLLRGYFIWVASLTNFKDQVSILQLIFPQPSQFYLSLLSGASALVLFIVVSQRRPEAPSWVRSASRHLPSWFLIALLIDLAINTTASIWFNEFSLTLSITQLIIVMISAWFLFTSNRVKLNTREFPEPLPERKRAKYDPRR